MVDNLYGRHGNTHGKETKRNRRTTPTTAPIIRQNSTPMTRTTRPVPETRKMYLRRTIHRIPWSESGKRYSTNGRHQSRKSKKLDNTNRRHRNPKIPRFYRILPILHTGLLSNSSTTTGANTQRNPMALDRTTTRSI